MAPRPRSTETVRFTAPPSATDVTAPPVSVASTVTAAASGSACASATVKVREASSVALPTVPEYAFSVTASSARLRSLVGGVMVAVNDRSTPLSVPEIPSPLVVLNV